MLASIAFSRAELVAVVLVSVAVGTVLATWLVVWVLENSKVTRERIRKRTEELKRKAGR